MTTKNLDKSLEKKLKVERIEACLSCKKFVDCENIGKFEECLDFEETSGPLVVRCFE